MGCLNPSSWRLTACTIRIPILLGLLAWVWYPDAHAAKNKPVVYHSHVKSGTAAEYSASGELFAVANDKRIWIFESHTLKQLSEMRIVEYVNYDWKFEYRYGLGNSLAFLSDERIATAGLGGMVTIWDTAMGNLVETIDWDTEDGFPIALAFSPQSGALAIGTAKGVVFLVWPGHTRARERLSAYGGAIMALQFSGDGRYVAAAGTGKEMVIWDTQAMAEFARIPTKGVILDVERFGKSGQFLVAGSGLEIWNFMSQEEVQALADPSLKGQAVGYGALLTLSILSLVYPFNPYDPVTAASSFVALPDVPKNAKAMCNRAVAVAPDGQMIADMHPGLTRERIRIIDPETDKEIQSLNPRGGRTCDMAFSPDGSQLLITNSRGAHVYDTQTWDVQKVKIGVAPLPK